MRETIDFDIEYGEEKKNIAHFKITKLSAFDSMPLQFIIKGLFAKTLNGKGIKDKDLFAAIGGFMEALTYEQFTDIRCRLFTGVKHTGSDVQGKDPIKAYGSITKSNEQMIFDDELMVYELFYKALEVNYKRFLGDILRKMENLFPEVAGKMKLAITEAKTSMHN